MSDPKLTPKPIPTDLLDVIHDQLTDYAESLWALATDAGYANLPDVEADARRRVSEIQETLNQVRELR